MTTPAIPTPKHRLVLEQHGFELEDKVRLHNAYPLTTAGRQAVEKGTT